MSTIDPRSDVSERQRSTSNGRWRAGANGAEYQAAASFPFDAAEAERFLALLDGEADRFVFAAGDDDKERKARLLAEAKAENKPRPFLWRHRWDSIGRASGWIEAQQASGWGAFVAVQAMKAAKCRIDDLACIRVIYAEMDIGEPLQPWPIEPSIIVESSPGRNHFYWLVLSEEPISAEDFQGIMMGIVETYGGDPAAKDLARRLRLPGTWNLKPGREPHLVKVIHESGARYSREELLAAFPPPPRPKPDPSKPRPKFNGTAPGLERFVGRDRDGPLWAISPDGYGDWLRVGMALHAETTGGADGLALWDGWSSPSQKWAPGTCEQKWRTFGGRPGVTGGTIFGMASDRGWSRPERRDWRDEGSGQRGAAEETQAKPPPPRALEFDDEITIDTSVDALVKGVLHPGDVAALYGPSGVGKTFAGIDLGYHVALGRDWHGRRVRQAPVLYVGLEGARGVRHRMKACAERMGSTERMFARMTIHAPLDKSEAGKIGQAAIIAQARLLAEAAGKPVGLITIDTLARAIAGDDENSAQDMAAFVGRVSAIARATGAAVIVVHHPGKDDARGMRGSTALFAACDAVIKISANGNVREVTAEKVKDGVIGPLFSYQLKQVVLGIDEDGDEITSCTVEPVSAPPAPRRAKLSTQHGRALDQLLRFYTDDVARYIDPKAIDLADIDPRYIPKVVTREEWRQACQDAQLTATGKASSERVAFMRAVEELEKAGIIARYGEYVWLLGQKPSTAEQRSQERVN